MKCRHCNGSGDEPAGYVPTDQESGCLQVAGYTITALLALLGLSYLIANVCRFLPQ